MDPEELFDFIRERYENTARKTLDNLFWCLDRHFSRDSYPITCIARPTTVAASGGSRIFFGTNGKVVQKRYDPRVSHFSLTKENDFLLVEEGWNSILVFVFYSDRKVPPL